MTRQEIANIFREAASAVEKQDTWTDELFAQLSSAARNCAPHTLAAVEKIQAEQSAGKKLTSRTAFNAMVPADQMAYMKSGGKLLDV